MLDVLSALPPAWRAIVFQSSRRTKSLAQLLEEWFYYYGDGLFSACFKDDRLQQRHGFEFINWNLCVRTHDELVGRRLWVSLNLDGELGTLPKRTAAIGIDALRPYVQTVLDAAAAPTETRERLTAVTQLSTPEHLLAAKCVVEFGERLYADPWLADRLLGHPLSVMREACQVVDTMLHESTDASSERLHAPRARPQPRSR
jgi:hypothetical protein